MGYQDLFCYRRRSCFCRGYPGGTISPMLFPGGGNFISGCICSLMIGSVAVLSVRVGAPYSSPASRATTTTTRTTTAAATKPTPETINVELNAEGNVFSLRARGVFRPMPAMTLPADLLGELGAMA